MDPAGSQEKQPVPKFASFKAPPAPSPAVDRSSERRSRDSRGEERSKHHSSRHRSHRDRSRSREKRRERREHHSSRRRDERGEEAAAERRREHRPAVTGIREEDKDLFVIDTKGDRYNVLYGTLHRYSIPEYRRFGRGSVLGLPPNYKIDRETEGNTLVIRTGSWKPGSSKLKSKNILSGLRKEKGKLLQVRPQLIHDTAADGSEDFLSLDVSTHRPDQAGMEDVDSDDNEKYAYRSIHGKAKPEDYLPKGVEAVSGTDSEDEGYTIDLNEEIKQTNAELIRKTQENPSDVEAWLRLIDHQDALLTGTTEESRSLTYAERTSLADIKVSIYQKALKQAGQASAKERLLLGLLAEGAKLWDTKKLAEQWQSTLKANSHFIGLWVKYLDFRQTQFLDFTYDRCLSTFIDCLKLSQSGPDNPEKVYVQNYLFLRLTLFMREAGFVEQAVGLWQAILELVFFRPEGLDLQNDREKSLSQLVQFWESEVARIGDPGAKGWKNGNNASLEPIALSKSAPVVPKLVFESWTTSERERITKARLPARSLDELEDDDPFRVVLSSDFSEVILLLCDLVPADLLIDGFLYFCHLPPLVSPNNAQTTGRWRSDNFVQNGYMSYPDFTLDEWFIGPEKETGNIAPGLLSFPHPNFTQSLDTLFPGHQMWFSSFQSWAKTANIPSDIDPDWVRRALRLLVEANPANDDLAEYLLALEFVFNGKEAKKFAKSLLKKRSSGLRLYNAYALMEYRSENHSAASHVWATALSMSKTLGDNSRADNGLLWRTWIWETLDALDLSRASQLLVALPHESVDLKSITEVSDQPVFSATNLLKTQNFLSDAQEHALATRKANIFVAYTDCLAILTYLSQSSDLEKAVETFSTAIRRLAILPAQAESFRSFTVELLHQSQAKLIFYHVRKGNAYKPSHIRTLLTDSITQHPHNTIFLCLFAWNESRSRIDERVREVVRSVTHTPNSANQSLQVPVTTHLFSIYSELSRPVYAGSTLYSVRAAFEKAIGDPKPSSPSSSTTQSSDSSNTSNSTARSNVTIWKLYILFELSRGNVQRAKDVFYRAMRSCPWSKELIMLAFGHLRVDIVQEKFSDEKIAQAGMGFGELKGIYNVLVEKELRIHVDIEGLLDEIAMDGTAQQQQGSGAGLPFTMPEDAGSGDEMQL